MTSGGYVNPEWETCITSGDQCLLDYTDPTNVEPLRSTKCKRGSVPAYLVNHSLMSYLKTVLTRES